MHVENITSNAMSLDRNGQSMLIQVYEKEINRLNNIINEAKEECKSVIEDSEHTTVSEFNINGLMRTILKILNKGENNE